MAAEHWTPHPAVRSEPEQLSRGERAAEWTAAKLGSWGFIILQTFLVLVWIAMNLAVVTLRWDPYPFILLNLAFSTQAAFAAPVLQLAQNRVDKRRAELALHQYEMTQEILLSVELLHMSMPRNPES